jgi:CubicO group peptidase (beta-lactamase class C family)
MNASPARLVWPVIALLVSSPIWAEEGTMAPDRGQLARAIDSYLEPYLERDDLSGNLLVAHGREIVYERSFGMANFELGVPNGLATRFNVASVTKPMTVIALIALATEGKLSPDDPLEKWVPGFPRGDEITVGHLARHRAGIPHRLTEEHDETVPRTAADMVELARRTALISEPGETHNYSSGGFSVLARVLELASGQTYAELLQDRVFETAGMTHSAHVDSRAILAGRASSYLPGADGGITNAKLKDLSFLVGAGSVYSTARDLHAMLIAVREGRYGPGVEQSFVDETGVDWNGVTNGYRAFADWHRAGDVTVVWTSNLQTGAANRMRRDLPRIAAGAQVPTPSLPDVKPVRVDPETLRRWEGIYQLRPGSTLRVHVDVDVLRANDWVLVPTGERLFYSPQDYAEVRVVLNDAGQPERLDWIMDGKPHACPRIGDL